MRYRPELNNIPFLPKLNLQEYERYNPTAFNDSLTILEKINKMIYQMNNLGVLTNNLFEQWNELVKWILGNGLNDIVSEEIQKRIDDGTFDNLFNSILGDLANLTTIDKTTIVNAINEVNEIAKGNRDNIGDMDALTTPNKDTLVDAINDLKIQFDINEQAVITIGEATGHGIISGLKVTQQQVLAMAVQVGNSSTPNIVHMKNGVRYTPDSIALPIDESHPSMDRKDIIYVSVDGVISYLAGEFSLTPTPPLLPDGAELLAIINVPRGDTTTNNADIEDKRAIKSLTHLKTSSKENLVLAINDVYDMIVDASGSLDEELREKFQELLDILGNKDDINVTDTTTFVTAINEIINNIGNLADLNTDVKNNVVSALNELVSKIGDLDSLLTTNKTNIVEAINEIATLYATKQYVDTITDGIIDTIGDLNQLTGSAKDNIVNAINEVRRDYATKIFVTDITGDKANLLTTVKTDLVSAINEIVNNYMTDVEGEQLIQNLKDYVDAKFDDIDSHLGDYALKTELGDLSELKTKDKTSAVVAINELKDGLASSTNRASIMYFGADSYRTYMPVVPLNGFRFRGQPSKIASKVITRDPTKVESISSQLGGQTSMTYESWYAAFGVENMDGSTGVLHMPMIRASSIVGNVFYYGRGGEFSTIHTNPKPAPYSYSFPDDILKGCDVLVINESIGGRDGQHSGRLTKVMNNTNTSVTLEDIGTIKEGDYILIAPPNVKDYGYIGSLYYDTQEIRNISDSGVEVKATMVYLSDAAPGHYPLDKIVENLYIDFRGYINPLGTGIFIAPDQTFTTTEVGQYVFYTYSDSSRHYTDTLYQYKSSAGNQADIRTLYSPFTFGQTLYFSASGDKTALDANAVRKLQIKGWTEL